MNISPFLTINSACDGALQWAKERLLHAGLRPVQTFDLHAARLGLHGCRCPQHGTQDCDCQLVVLLVYGSGEKPVSLILHGNNGQTWFSIADPPDQKIDAETINTIWQTLEAAVPIFLMNDA